MAKKFDFLSPGIEMREIDQSGIATQRDEEGPIIIGRTRKGPANKPVKIRNLDDYIAVFGAPVAGGTGDQGDIWREGNTTGPTYAAYAAQAWLASEESPIVMVRVAGEQHPNAADAGKAGWALSASVSSTNSTNSTAYGLFLCDSGSKAMGTGSLAAVIYCNRGYMGLTGKAAADPGGSDVIEAGTLIKSNASNYGFSLKVYDQDGTLKESPSFNFSRNSSQYIRSVLNTNPQLVNETMISSADRKTYWLGETFNRAIEDNLSNSASGEVYGILLPLVSGSLSGNNWADRKQAAQEAKSGWVFSQKETNQVYLFRLKCLHVGDDFQKNHMIAIENIREPSNRNVDAYGTFSVAILDLNGTAIERYNNLNLNPASPNYIAKVIGDQYQSWDNTNRRYRTYGDYPNRSDLVYVEVNQNIADGGGGGLLPAGFKGPVRPKGFTIMDGRDGALTLGHADPGNPATLLFIWNGTAEDDVTSGRQAAFTANGTAYTITFTDGATDDISFSGGAATLKANHTSQASIRTALTTLLDSISGYSAYEDGNTVVMISDVVVASTYDFSSVSENISPLSISAIAGSDETVDGGVFAKGNDVTLITGGTATEFAAGPVGYTASFNFPAIPLRSGGTDGGAADPYRCYWGIRPKLSATSPTNDADYCDYLRGLNAISDSFAPGNDDFEHSICFSLDDILVNTDDNTVRYISGSYERADSASTDPSYTKGTGSFGDLLDLNVRQFLMPMWGGSDGLDITEKEPLRNGLIGTSWSETTNHVQYSLNKAIDAVKDPEVVPANLLLAPGIRAPLITNKLISTAESRKDVLAIIDIENDYMPTHESTDSASSRLGSVTSAVSTLKGRNLNSSYACCFYPWVQIADNLSGGHYVWIPSSVAGLGAMAKSQAKSDVWFAPAGFNRGGLGNLGGSRGPAVVQARQRLDSNERDKLYEVNINPIATFPAEGVVIFGQKTLQAGTSALDRINVRRLLLHLKSKVSTVSRNLLFDQNIDSTWARFKSQVNPILANVQARFGLTDYKLILDETTTTADLIDRNIMYAKIYIKPARAIEYIVVDFVITKTGADFV
tara:strand:- start:1129 stop:4335 length:3207 start_codon:yes stop_codon:yes gene_type:complete